jgi:hypothetical protein
MRRLGGGETGVNQEENLVPLVKNRCTPRAEDGLPGGGTSIIEGASPEVDVICIKSLY